MQNFSGIKINHKIWLNRYQIKKYKLFQGLGNYYDKVQRLKNEYLISDELLISKEKIEIASSICKVDLLSDLVGEFPELQGVLGGYFAAEQGFEKEVCVAVVSIIYQ